MKNTLINTSSNIILTQNQSVNKLIIHPAYISGFTQIFVMVIILSFILFKPSVTFCDSTDLVVWGSNLSSSVGYPRFTSLISKIIQLPPYYYGLVIGLLLSDGWSSKGKPHWNSLLGFRQSLKNFEYFWFVYVNLSHFCSKFPYLSKSIQAEVYSYSVTLQTRSLPCFTTLHSLFYVNGIKVVPKDIYNMLTPVALAHIIMSDGSVQRHGLIICTDSFKLSDVVRLINVLIIRYDLDCIIRYHNKYPSPEGLSPRGEALGPRIYIRQKSLSLLRKIVTPYMHTSIMYKLGKLESNNLNMLKKPTIISNFSQTKRNYSNVFVDNKNSLVKLQNNKLKIHPAYISGFTQSDGCFHVAVDKNKSYKLGLRVTPKFILSQHIDATSVFELIRDYFNVGHLTKNRKEINYVVNSFIQLKQVIIPHLEKYPVRAGKLDSFLKFKKVIEIMDQGYHLQQEGLAKIIEISYSINTVSSRTLTKKQELLKSIGINEFVVVDQPIVPPLPILDPYFVLGLVDGDGSFNIAFDKNNRIRTNFTVVQDIACKEVLVELTKYFNCGAVYDLETNAARFQVTSLDKIITHIIPNFTLYNLLTEKKTHFDLFNKICQLLKNKHQKTENGFLEILELAYNMNKLGKGRKLTKQEYLQKVLTTTTNLSDKE